MKNMIKKNMPLFVRNAIKKFMVLAGFDPWINRSWSQEGEDIVLRRIFENKSKGFYVDVGAHHPRRYSNTYLLYLKGWHGINIDAMPGSMKLFNQDRPRDINIEVGIGLTECQLDYYVFNETALNGFSKELSIERNDLKSIYQIKEIFKVNVMPLSFVLDRYLINNKTIDFMTIDVEGLDFEVLKSNDWKKYRPYLVLVEILNSSLHDIGQSQIGRFMSDVGYEIYAKCVNTVFFKVTDKN